MEVTAFPVKVLDLAIYSIIYQTSQADYLKVEWKQILFAVSTKLDFDDRYNLSLP